MRILLSGTALVACLALTACPPNSSVDSGPLDDASPPRQTQTNRPGNSPKPSASPTPSKNIKSAKPSAKPEPSKSPAPGGEDDADSGPRAATGGSGVPGAPRVFLALHGTQEVLSGDKDEQWSYVRNNLDGIWGNGAKMTLDDQVKIWHKVKTRNVISEVDFPDNPNDKLPSVEALAGASTVDPSIKMNREAVAMHTSDPKTWEGRDFDDVMERYVTGSDIPAAYRYKTIYTGWNVRNWVDPALNAKIAEINAEPITGRAATIHEQATGQFVECGHGFCARERGGHAEGLERAIRSSHAKNEPFIWFTSPGPDGEPQVENFKGAYNLLKSKGLWRTNDAVVMINYQGEFPMLPETVNGQPANTVTGMLYWALKQ
jgi:hypothetical protein